MKHRVLRSHNCAACCFRNEFPVATIEADAPDPAIDWDELEVCPGAGCRKLVPPTVLLRLPLRAVDIGQRAGG